MTFAAGKKRNNTYMDYKEFPLANTSDLGDGEMKEVSADETRILLARVGGEFHAVGATLPALRRAARRGRALRSARRLPVAPRLLRRDDGRARRAARARLAPAIRGARRRGPRAGARARRGSKTACRRACRGATRPTRVCSSSSARARPATPRRRRLREDGFRGRVALVTREDRAPYDRPNLSKDYLQGHAEPEWMPLRAEEFYRKHDIGLLCEHEVTRVDAAAKTVTFDERRHARLRRAARRHGRLAAPAQHPRLRPQERLPAARLQRRRLAHRDGRTLKARRRRRRRASSAWRRRPLCARADST